MQIRISSNHATGESKESRDQIVDRLDGALRGLAWSQPPLHKIRELVLNASIAHPAFGESPRPRRGFYHKPTGTYIISAPPPDYAAWAKPDWNSRIRLVVETLHAVVGRIPKTRLDANERSVLHGLLDKAAELAAIRPPARIARVSPIYRFSSGAISFQPFEQPPPGGIAISPAEADAFARECRNATASEFTGPLKLYRRVDGALYYREIWASGRVAVEHWGKCGERGEMSERSLAPDETIKGALDEFALRTRKLNYQASRGRATRSSSWSTRSTVLAAWTTSSSGTRSKNIWISCSAGMGWEALTADRLDQGLWRWRARW